MKKIVLIGDSIREGYQDYVKMAFDGIAEVFYPDENCRFSAYVLRGLVDWKDRMGCGDNVDCVHWNAGLWDALVLSESPDCDPDGINLVSVDIYKYYIDKICIAIKKLFPKAEVIFATSTRPLDLSKTNTKYTWRVHNIEAYNHAALEIVTKHGFAVDDLYEITKDAPEEYHSDRVHYYTKDGTRILTGRVVESIERCLKIQGKKLDFDKLFATPEDVILI